LYNLHMRILFAGTPEVAIPSLRKLAMEHTVVAVLTKPDSKQGRGRVLVESHVKAEAKALGLDVIELDPNSEEFLEFLKTANIECVAVVAYGKLIKKPALDAVSKGWVNLHFSLLPDYRGAAPVQRAIFNGETKTGISVFQIDVGLDDGPIFAQDSVDILESETSGDLLERLSFDGAEMLLGVIDAIEAGMAISVEQETGVNVGGVNAGVRSAGEVNADSGRARAGGAGAGGAGSESGAGAGGADWGDIMRFKTAPKISKDEARVDWNDSPSAIVNKIRACNPSPLAWCIAGDIEMSLISARVVEGSEIGFAQSLNAGQHQACITPEPSALRAGELYITKKQVFVGAGENDKLVELLRVHPKAKKEMNAADWARGIKNITTLT
jgi:methionyl-tRNA formyltransferase